MDNKVFSSRQEKMVADYMDWKVVSGSGARPFTPGDVANSQWLVECKTHNTEQKNVVFHKTHWQKISKEARSVNKYQVLVTDNGTQKPEDTWVIIPTRLLPKTNVCAIIGLVNTSRTDNTITFNAKNTYNIVKNNRQDGMINFCAVHFGNESLALLTLDEFRNFYQQEFES